MVKNREVDPLVNQNTTNSRNASLTSLRERDNSKGKQKVINPIIIHPVPTFGTNKCESPTNKKKINPELNGLLTPLMDKSPFTAKITRADRTIGLYNSPAINKFTNKK